MVRRRLDRQRAIHKLSSTAARLPWAAYGPGSGGSIKGSQQCPANQRSVLVT